MSLVPYGGGGAMSLQVPPLTPANYTSWAIKVEAILDAQGLWCAVAPVEGAAVDAGKSKTARAAMLGALSEDVLMQVATKTTAKEVWDSLKVRFVGADRVRAARLATLRGEFDRLRMDDGDELDAYAGKISSMAATYAGRGATLDDAAMVKKLLDTVPDRLYAAVAGIEQFCDVEVMAFEEALGRLKAFEERTRRRAQVGGDRAGEQLMLTAAQWAARQRQQGGGGFHGERGGEQLLLTATQWEARRRQRAGGHHDNDDVSNAGAGGRGRRGKCHNCGIRGHFARDCRQPKKEDQALLAGVDDEPALL